MSYSIEFEPSFKKDFKTCLKRKLNMNLFEEVYTLFSENGKLPLKYKPHVLKGNWKGFMECHIQADWLLIWDVDHNTKTIVLVRMGKHDDLF
ncbi:MAG: type II toxin-antitoxin system YafQ family toxin [Bacteroidota bacterium]